MTLPIRRRRYPARRWDPSAGLPGFDDLFAQMNHMLTTAFPEVARISVRSWSPPVDIQETDDAYLIEADMPGVRPDDVNVDLQGKELRISGEYGTGQQGDSDQGGEQGEGGQGGEQQRLRRSGRFDYQVTLPGEVTTESCTAELDHGVLRLRLPKTSTGRQRIQVTTGQSGQADAGRPLEGGSTQDQAAESGTGTAATSTGDTTDDQQSGEQKPTAS
ncbi:MAG TPA: Hsp20/alpha crystallin family protein [Pseudonocardiaceae bacterium]|jgi:HSP20 family protein|nr:Hsp20/alpha crystallin family protein [Pseudonocardiaceae bacterium]